MRELKFRAWDGVNQHYFYNIAIYPNNVAGVQRHNVESEMLKAEYGATHWTELGENTIIEQYTGLKDKNGKEIYEGDIIEVETDCFNYEEVSRYEVFWNEAMLDDSLRLISGTNYDDYVGELSPSAVSVIGNIHENPELLGGKK